jgi:hypothetical protein
LRRPELSTVKGSSAPGRRRRRRPLNPPRKLRELSPSAFHFPKIANRQLIATYGRERKVFVLL